MIIISSGIAFAFPFCLSDDGEISKSIFYVSESKTIDLFGWGMVGRWIGGRDVIQNKVNPLFGFLESYKGNLKLDLEACTFS